LDVLVLVVILVMQPSFWTGILTESDVFLGRIFCVCSEMMSENGSELFSDNMKKRVKFISKRFEL
jgi:hypothetical protein